MSLTTTETASQQEQVNPIHPDMLGRLDPQFVDFYNKNLSHIPNRPIDLGALRKTYSGLYSYAKGPVATVGRTYDSKIPVGEGVELDVRVYEPSTNGPWGVHIDYHGGGWGLGDLETEAQICKHICHDANVAVIDVAYRLVPENPYPTGVLDSFAALKYIHEHGAEKFNIKTNSISMGGVSAGANIALVCSHWARDAGIPIRLVTAGTPVIDDLSRYSSASDSPYKSMQENQFAPTLSWARLEWFEKLKESSFSKDPATAEKQKQGYGWIRNLMNAPNFKNLPRTVVYTAGADPLRDEGEAYANKLVEHGNEVVLKRFIGVPHPFMHMDGALEQAAQFIAMIAQQVSYAHEHS